MFNFTMSSLLSSLIFGIIGMWLFKGAKKDMNLRLMGVALGLMVFPYFTKGPVADWGVGLFLCALAYFFY